MTTGQKAPHRWQTEAHAEVRQGWRNSSSYRALIAACPGAGKTRVAVQLADELLREGVIELALVIVPTVNIQQQWVEVFKSFGINATCDADNESLRWRQREGRTMREDKAVIVVTYAQVERDPRLFAELVRRHPTLVIGDEAHHCVEDAKFGDAINIICENAVHTLALSGTPFHTAGKSLALCESVPAVDDDGKIIQRTKETYAYSYAKAIDDHVCRIVDFAKVEGKGRVTFRSLTDHKLFDRLISTTRKSDPIGLLLDPDGEYMGQCIRSALESLTRMREAGDLRAAMLVVAKDVKHGNRLISAIERIKQENSKWAQFANIQGIYNDTERAHARTAALERDTTDIVVSVRMISEGVDVKRLRVGVYATDWMTRMFFVQFVGRFVRYEMRPPLDDLQHAVVVCPAHPDLMKWTAEIERMILASQIKLAMDYGVGGTAPERKAEVMGVETRAGNTSHTCRGEETASEPQTVAMMRQKSSVFMSMADALVLRAARDLGMAASAPGDHGNAAPVNWRDRNNNITKQIVRLQRANGEDDRELYRRVNGIANSHVGIPTMDGMTSEAVLQKRHAFLQDMLRRIVQEQNPAFDWGEAS